MSEFASGTTVSASRSRDEIENLLMKYGACSFAYMRDEGIIHIAFRFKNLNVRMKVTIPARDDKRFTVTPTGRRRTGDSSGLYEQEVCRRWRCLTAVIKAKLVAVTDGVATFEQEFLPYLVTSTGETMGERLLPAVIAAKTSGQLLLTADGGQL